MTVKWECVICHRLEQVGATSPGGTYDLCGGIRMKNAPINPDYPAPDGWRQVLARYDEDLDQWVYDLWSDHTIWVCPDCFLYGEP